MCLYKDTTSIKASTVDHDVVQAIGQVRDNAKDNDTITNMMTGYKQFQTFLLWSSPSTLLSAMLSDFCLWLTALDKAVHVVYLYYMKVNCYLSCYGQPFHCQHWSEQENYT